MRPFQVLEVEFKCSDEFILNAALVPSNFKLDKRRAVGTSMELRVMNEKQVNMIEEIVTR